VQIHFDISRFLIGVDKSEELHEEPVQGRLRARKTPEPSIVNLKANNGTQFGTVITRPTTIQAGRQKKASKTNEGQGARKEVREKKAAASQKSALCLSFESFILKSHSLQPMNYGGCWKQTTRDSILCALRTRQGISLPPLLPHITGHL
jgi:hypothetical protein